MKKVLVIVVILLINCFSCKQAKTTKNHSSFKVLQEQSKQKTEAKQPKQKDKLIEKKLVSFYKKYMLAQDKNNIKEIFSLKKKYLTKSLLDKINKGFYDYDPILNAQDVDENNAKTIKVSKGKGFYKVCYTWVLRNEITCIKLNIIKTEEGIKISKFIE